MPPAAGDAGTAVGGALHLSWCAGAFPWPMSSADLGPEYDDQAIEEGSPTPRSMPSVAVRRRRSGREPRAQ